MSFVTLIILKDIIMFKEKKDIGTSEKFLTRKEVANLFSVCISTVNNWKNKGEINAYQVGGRVYFKFSELEQSLIKIN